MNGVRYFLDSNALLYPYDDLSPVRRDRAKLWLAWLWENQCGAVSRQVLQEFCWNALRRFRVPREVDRQRVKLMAEWHPPQVTITLIERAWYWTDQTQVRFWYGLTAAAGERMIGSITILDPFKASPPVS